MSKYHDHRSDCPFKFAPLDVCDCVEHNMLDHIKQLVAANKSLIKELEELEAMNKNQEAMIRQADRRGDALEAKLAKVAEAEKEIAAHKGKAEVHSEVRTYWSDYEEYCAMAEIENSEAVTLGEKT